jgi:hypothetical protein
VSAGTADAPIPLRAEGVATPGLTARGRVMRVFERESVPQADGSTFWSDHVVLFSGQEGELFIECARSRDGSAHPVVAAAHASLPTGDDEFGRTLTIPVRARAAKDRVYLKATWPSGRPAA